MARIAAFISSTARVARRVVRILITVLGSIALTIGFAVAAAIALFALGIGWQPVRLNEPRRSIDFPTVGPASLFFDDHYDPSDARRNAFVGVAISGGGSRAAVFAAEVLSALAELGFLDHVTAISSVSGGSLPAAFYALSTRDPRRWPIGRIRDLMATDFHDDLVRALFEPSTLLRTLGSPYSPAKDAIGNCAGGIEL